MIPTVAGIKNNGNITRINPAPSLTKASGMILKYKHKNSSNKPTILPGIGNLNNEEIESPT